MYLILTSSIHRTLLHQYLFLEESVEIRLFTLRTLRVCVCLKCDTESPHRYKRAKAQIPAGISEQPDSTETTSQNHRSKMKAWFVLFLLLPLCMGKSFHIVCYHCWRFLLCCCKWWILAENSWSQFLQYSHIFLFTFKREDFDNFLYGDFNKKL